MNKIIYCIVLLAFASFADVAIGKPKKETVGVASVIDGDTIEIRGQRFRLFGMDAFESNQLCTDRTGKKYRCGQLAANFLYELINDRNVTCTHKGKSWNRIVAVCKAAGTDLGKFLVESGWALAYRKYSKRYIPDELRAEQLKLGAWSGEFTPPWEFRKKKRK